MSLSQKISDAPGWVNVAVMVSGWMASILQPIAILVTIVWGVLQSYAFVRKHFFGGRKRRKGDA